MSTDPAVPLSATDGLPDDAVLLFNRALVVMQSVRTAVHELNNVFQTISGSVELLQNQPSLPDTLRPRLEAIHRQSGRGEAIVRSIGDLARRDSPGVQTVDLDALIDAALEARRFEHRRAGITATRTARTSGPWTLRADPADVQQMLLSLLIAAEHGLLRGGTLAITLARDGGNIALTIAHRAHDAANAAQLARPGVEEPAGGVGGLVSGLGWTAARTLAARLGGDLQVEVTVDGTVNRLTVPFAATPPS